MAADRGRIVREAISVLLADLGERGDDSILVRRLRGAVTAGRLGSASVSSETGAAPEAPVASGAAPSRFTVRLTNFEGPFDLLLQLIGKHKLDVTEIALSKVTDEFIAHLRALGDELDLDQASEFLVVASTLLDLKAARLLPAADVDDEDDLELLEARDLLFARLLQYKAYKQAARFLRERETEAAHRFPRSAALEPRFADLVPEVVLDLSPEQFAALAARVLAPKAPEVVSVSHLHAPPVSVSEQLLAVRNQLLRVGDGDLPGAHRRLRAHPRGGRPVPGPAGALPPAAGGLRAADAAGGAARALDRLRGTGRAAQRRRRRRRRGPR